jgi:hypothetical protein
MQRMAELLEGIAASVHWHEPSNLRGFGTSNQNPSHFDDIAQHCNDGGESAMNPNQDYSRPRIFMHHHNM